MKAAPASSPPRTPRTAATLRRIGLLLPRGRLGRRLLLASCRGGALLPCRRLPRRRRLDAAQRRLEVVEDEAHRGVAAGRRGDARLALADDEHAPLSRRDLQLRERALAGFHLVGGCEEVGGSLRELLGSA